MKISVGRLCLLILICTSIQLPLNVLGQKLVNSCNSSYYTYIYRISNEHASEIVHGNFDFKADKYLNHLVDSFHTDKSTGIKLPVGHYLFVHTLNNSLVFEIKSESNLSLNLVNNSEDLCLMVSDSTGRIIPDAVVYLKHKRIRFDKKTQLYRLKFNNRIGILEVRSGDQSAFLNITRQRNNPQVRRILQKTFFSSPVKYISTPVYFAICLPIDVVKSVVKLRMMGMCYYITKPFRETYYWIKYQGDPFEWFEHLFSRRHHSYYSDYQNNEDYSGVLYFDKPRYRPGDTVSLQAFAMTKRYTPLSDSLLVTLGISPQKDLKYIKPIRPGVYELKFILTPDLKLQLDHDYKVNLYLSKDKRVASGEIRYEDYELKTSDFFLRSEKDSYLSFEHVVLFARGLDENDLYIPDVKMELSLLATGNSKIKYNNTFIPDTLWHYNTVLDPSGELKIEVPDSIFPEADIKVQAMATFLTSNNERVTKAVSLNRINDNRKIDISLINDSIVIQYKEKGRIIPGLADLTIGDNPSVIIHLPWKEKFNPVAEDYTISKGDLTQTLSIADESPGVESRTSRNADSVWVSITNPHNLPLVYFVYKKDKCVFRGNERTSKFSCKNKSRENYFVSMHYLWAGKVVSKEYKIEYRDKELQLNVIAPPIVFPGQKVHINIVVTDNKGKALPNVSLLSSAFTKKFNVQHITPMPYPGKVIGERNGYNTFGSNGRFDKAQSNKIALDWRRWHAKMHLDTIELYRFLYPSGGVYQTAFPASDSVTQVAPFLVKNGCLAPVNILYLDGIAKYIDLTTTQQSYSFPSDSGWHSIRLRTEKQEIRFNRVYLKKGYKTILSIDVDSTANTVSKSPKSSTFTTSEKNLIYNTLVQIIVKPNEFAFIENPQHGELLQSHYYGNTVNIAGPINYKTFNYISKDGFQHTAEKEGNYAYDFYKGFYKMKWDFSSRSLFPLKTSLRVPPQNFRELTLSAHGIAENWQAVNNQIQSRIDYYDNVSTKLKGCGNIQFDFSGSHLPDSCILKHVLLIPASDATARIYAGSTRTIYAVPPGKYNLVLLLGNNYYSESKPIQVLPDGTNYYRFTDEKSLPADKRICAIKAIIQTRIKQRYTGGTDVFSQRKIQEQQQVNMLYHTPVDQCKTGVVIYGYITDALTGEPLIGVSIIGEGTLNGTITDINGYFNFCVPYNCTNIVTSYVGYKTCTKTWLNNPLNFELMPEINHLEEVVVVGYGTVKRGALGNLVSSSGIGIPSDVFQGKVAGVAINGDPGAAFAIHIRGIPSPVQGENTPLYVVDGVIYDGENLQLPPETIERLEVLKEATATALYGIRGVHGVVLITTKKGLALRLRNQTIPGAETGATSNENSIRSHFSDVAFWKPSLLSNKQGLVSFDVIFPDDITAWNTYYYAMGTKKTGQTSGKIKSFKSLTGTLSLPRFLISGDITNIQGKTINYNADTLRVKTSFNIAGKDVKTNNHTVISSVLDTFQLHATDVDTLKVTYAIMKDDDGYVDGEKHDLPVLPKGTTETSGNFWVLENDTTFNFRPGHLTSDITIQADAYPVSFALDELKHIRNYRYLCNEQLASKLKGLIAEKRIYNFLQKDFPYNRDVKSIISKLKKSQNNIGLWGWWTNTSECIWISVHVAEGLLDAQQEGFSLNFDLKPLMSAMTMAINAVSDREKIRIIKLLSRMDSIQNYINYIDQINLKKLNFSTKLEYIELLQHLKMPVRLDTLMSWKKETALGNSYWGIEELSLFDDALPTTALIYRIFKAGNYHTDLLPKMKNYFLERRSGLHWRNTYESINLLTTLLPDILINNTLPGATKLKISSLPYLDVTTFPMSVTTKTDSVVKITKTGAYPLYLTIYQQFRNNNPKTYDNDFIVSSQFEGSDSILTAGKPVALVVQVTVKKSSEYVMIEIPVPAGCSYDEKNTDYGQETYREYFKEKTTVFCNKLPAGTYQYRVKLLPRYTGIYTLNPARAELMYFPSKYGRTRTKQVIIHEKI